MGIKDSYTNNQKSGGGTITAGHLKSVGQEGEGEETPKVQCENK